MKKILLFTLILSLVAIPAIAGEPEWLIENEGGFMYRIPEGWVIKPVPGLKYRFAFGPTRSAFTPNINVVDEVFDGELSTYVDANLDTMKRIFQNFTVVVREPFYTTDGQIGVRLVIKNRQNNVDLKQTFYFFKAIGSRYFVATCTDLASNGDALDSTFFESMKTFKIQ